MPPQRLGWPQVFAVLLLLAFVLQSFWLIHRLPLRRSEFAYAQAGVARFAGKTLSWDRLALPVPAAIAALPALFARRLISAEQWKWLLRGPFVVVGWLLGASIWYVARRLYGNPGGYIALTLYCFSPAVLFSSPGPLLTSSLGIFGTIFVSIAAAHTLYAPPQAGIRELRSRWRRILLLGLAIALAVGSGTWSVVLILVALAFMVYLVPERKPASAALVISACILAAIVLLACFGFRPRALVGGVAQEPFFSFEMISSQVVRAYVSGILHAANPFLMLFAVISLIAWMAWRRTRYFGNTAPLLSLLVITALSLVAFADVLVGPFAFRAAPFLYVFIAGIFSDLLESRWRSAARLLLAALLLGYVVTAVLAVAQLRPGVAD